MRIIPYLQVVGQESRASAWPIDVVTASAKPVTECIRHIRTSSLSHSRRGASPMGRGARWPYDDIVARARKDPRPVSGRTGALAAVPWGVVDPGLAMNCWGTWEDAEMDAFAITGVSPQHDWFRVQAAVGGVESPARLFPRVHVVSSADIADLASGGRTISSRVERRGRSYRWLPVTLLRSTLAKCQSKRSRNSPSPKPRPPRTSKRCCPSGTVTSLTGILWTSSIVSRASAGRRRSPTARWS